MKADANRKHTKLDNIAFILFVLSLSYLVTACFFVQFKKTIFIYTGSELENKRIHLPTGGPSSSCEIIILPNNSHGGIIRVCMGIFTTALRNKKYVKFSKKKNLTLLPQCVACYLTAYFDEKSPFKRVVYFEVFNVHKKSPRPSCSKQQPLDRFLLRGPVVRKQFIDDN